MKAPTGWLLLMQINAMLYGVAICAIWCGNIELMVGAFAVGLLTSIACAITYPFKS